MLKKPSVLLIIDMQQDFCSNGSLTIPHAEQIITIINELMTQYDFVVASQDWHPYNHLSFANQHPGKKPFQTIILPTGKQILWPVHCVQETWGAELHCDLNQNGIHTIVRKAYQRDRDSYSAFFDTENDNNLKVPTLLDQILTPYKDQYISICGLARSYCVEATFQDAIKLGYKANVIENACRDIKLAL